MSFPSDNGATEDQVLDLDSMPAEALAVILEVELPDLTPRFGLMPDPLMGPELETDKIWHRLERVMDDPVQIFRWRCDKRVVHVLRQWVLVVWASGLITPLEWHATSCGVIHLRPVPPEQLDLCHLASASDWYARHKDATRWEYVHDHVAKGGSRTSPSPRASNTMAFNALHGRVRQRVQSRQLDRRILDALDLNERVLADVRWLTTEHRPSNSTAAVSWYNLMCNLQPALNIVRQDATELSDWFLASVLYWGFDKDKEPLLWLKERVRNCGVSQKGWVLLLKHGPTIWRQAREVKDTFVLNTAIDLLRLQTQIGGGTLIPDALMGSNGGNLVSAPWCWDDPGNVLPYLVQLWKQEPPATPKAEADWLNIISWLSDAGIPARLNKHQRQQGLMCLVRLANKWRLDEKRRCQLEEKERLQPLPVWHEPIISGPWRLHFLESRLAMLVEGSSMRHCLGQPSGPQPSPTHLFASVVYRNLPVATVWYEQKDGRWRLVSAYGPSNAELDSQQTAALKRVARLITTPIYPNGEPL